MSTAQGVARKNCNGCGVEKPLTDFHRRSGTHDGRQTRCKGCKREDNARYRDTHQEELRTYLAKWREENPTYQVDRRQTRPEVARDSDRRSAIRRHGVTVEEFAEQSARQGHCCATCGAHRQRLHIDHDHNHCPGQRGCRECVRGLLCQRCNSKEALAVGEAAWAEYISRPRPFVGQDVAA